MNSDRRNFWKKQNSLHQPSTSESYTESEFAQSNSVYPGTFGYSYGNSQTYCESSKQQTPLSRTISHIEDNIHSNACQLNLPQPKVNILDRISQNRRYPESFSQGKRNVGDFQVSNQHRLDSFGTLDFSESQLLEMRQLVGNLGQTIPQLNECRPSDQDHRQELICNQPNTTMPPLTGHLFQDRCAPRENFQLKKSELNSEINNASTFHIGPRNEYLHPENKYSSDFSNPSLGKNYYYSQQYLPDYKIEHSAQQHNSNRQTSEEVYETLNVQAGPPRISDPGQIPTGYGYQDSELSRAYAGRNLYQGSSQNDYSNPANKSIKNSSFTNRYSLKDHPMYQQGYLQSDKPINSSQLYEENRLISKEFSENLNFQACPPRFLDHRHSRHIQVSSKIPNNNQSSKYFGGKSMYLQNNLTSFTETIPKHKTTFDLSKNSNFGFKNNHRLHSHNPAEKKAPLINEAHVNEEKTYEQLTHKLGLFPSSATKNCIFQTSTSSVIFDQENRSKISNQERVNLSRCYKPPNGDKNETVSANYNANILQSKSFPKNGHSIRNLNPNKNLKAETSNRYSFAYPQYRNSSSRDQNEQIPPRINFISKPFICDVCGKRFQYKCRLTDHRRTHTNDRPFPCNMCSKRFKQKRHLTDHMRIHTDERPFSCNMCSSSFRQQNHLVTHLRTHT